jgi:hypothetical protein
LATALVACVAGDCLVFPAGFFAAVATSPPLSE